jgi:hypothetical protein
MVPSPEGGPPIWVAASEAVSPEGDLETEMFSNAMMDSLAYEIDTARRVRETRGQETSGARRDSRDECQVFTSSASHIDIPSYTFPSLRERAEIVVTGRVVEGRTGFYHGRPTTVYELAIDRVLKAPDPKELQEGPVYFTFGRAEIAAEGEMLCVRNDHYPNRPVTGGRVLIFAATIPDRDPLFIAAHQDEIFFETESGEVSFPELGENAVKAPTWEMIETKLDAMTPPQSKSTKESER